MNETQTEKKRENARGYRTVKRVLDILLSFVLLFFLALPMTLIGLAVGLSSRGGILFRQRRVGRGGRVFVCYKFRTMTSDAPHDRPSAAFDEAERYVTPVGRILRRTSLDELPQLWNVLRGQMSLVGPRPLIPEEGEIHRVRAENGVYAVRPGMTGLAQVSGRTALDDDTKAALDIRYVRTMSLRQDMHILGRTLFAVRNGE